MKIHCGINCVSKALMYIWLAGNLSSQALANTSKSAHNVVINLDREKNYDTGILAIFTCTLNNTSYIVSSCFSTLNGYLEGNLKIVSGIYTKTFPQAESIDDLGYNIVSFHLRQHCRVLAKIGSIESGFVLHLEVKNSSGQILFADDTQQFNRLSLSSD